MSTRANIIIKENKQKLIFYRHSDGYPEGTMPTLEKFIQLIKDGKLRNDLEQAAGWLIILGHNEYEQSLEKLEKGENNTIDWKVGAYEPCTSIHGDIEYLYTIDLNLLKITVKEI